MDKLTREYNTAVKKQLWYMYPRGDASLRTVQMEPDLKHSIYTKSKLWSDNGPIRTVLRVQGGTGPRMLSLTNQWLHLLYLITKPQVFQELKLSEGFRKPRQSGPREEAAKKLDQDTQCSRYRHHHLGPVPSRTPFTRNRTSNSSPDSLSLDKRTFYRRHHFW